MDPYFDFVEDKVKVFESDSTGEDADADDADEAKPDDIDILSEPEPEPKPKPEKRMLLVTNLAPLACQNECGYALKVPIKQCLAGHLICYDCHNNHDNCMLCDDELFPSPSVDAILTSVLDVCPFESCKKQIPFYQLHDHITDCGYSVKCPVPQCVQLLLPRSEMELHFTQIHAKHVCPFQFGFPLPFAFEMHDDTMILMETRMKFFFVVDYQIRAGSTCFKFYCINCFGGTRFKYKITDQDAKTTLLAESTVPIIALRKGIEAIIPGGVDALFLRGSLSNQLRTGDEGYLRCNFVITAESCP